MTIMNPNDETSSPHECGSDAPPGTPGGFPIQPTDGSADPPPLRQRSGWYTMVRVSPALLFTVAYAVLEHQYYAGGGRDGLNSLANGLYLLPLGFVGSLVVGVLTAGQAVRDRPPQRSAALVWVGTLILVVLLNLCLMFGGCLTVAKLRST